MAAAAGWLAAPLQALEWELIPPEPGTEAKAEAPRWELVPADELIEEPTDPPIAAPAQEVAPLDLATLRSAAALGPPLQLGLAVPTANRLDDAQLQVRFTQIWADGRGESSGTGNQNYAVRADFSLSDRWMVSGFASQADDPLYAAIAGKANPVANLWQVLGGSSRVRLAGDRPLWPQRPGWELALEGSLELFTVASGCGGSVSCGSSGGANIFNNSGSKVYTNNVVGSLALPLSWRATDSLQFTLVPGISVLPDSQGAGQGGAGTFYGTNVTLGAGASWRVLPELELLGSVLVPLGPGRNSFNSALEFARVPIINLGANVIFNPRISLQGALTNGFGATPATALLALPSDNRLLYSASFRWNPGEPDTPQGPLSSRQRSFSIGGLSVNTAWVPPSGSWQVSANADSRGNVFGFLGWSASNIFQFELFNGGVFNDVQPRNALVDTYANNGGFNTRIGGKLLAFSQLRGAPFTGAGRISLGRNNDDNFQGYLFGEWMGTWEASDTLAISLGPKLAWSGVESPWGFGLAANIQLGEHWQLIPEANLVASDFSRSNGTVALRWLANPNTFVDVYASTAAGLLDVGTLLSSDQVRVGTRISVLF
ncbi:hypothetical protein KBY57_00130 [Cyanobium sp. Aljojuca 7D2]|uniref:hypothetical protein n=1 Tax=Cyanobium sp. Aljojuca 7D2 TaxID=2823698 RepID=UPI0020CF6638|nr:hypothetical protein [Cyanobium sp. Aljojuca 7D2]MCP9889464.1 hypothetical protein [Cyanobium sp. Aljojuca 7D2]